MAFPQHLRGGAAAMDLGPAEIAGIGATVTAVVSFITGWRLHRGSVNTSTASQLWEQLNRGLTAAREDANLLRSEIRELRIELRQRDDTIERLETEGRRKSRQISMLEREVARLIELLPADLRQQYNATRFTEEAEAE